MSTDSIEQRHRCFATIFARYLFLFGVKVSVEVREFFIANLKADFSNQRPCLQRQPAGALETCWPTQSDTKTTFPFAHRIAIPPQHGSPSCQRCLRYCICPDPKTNS